MDERKAARALELPAKESQRHGLQYICCLNTGRVPTTEFQASSSPPTSASA